MAAANAQDTGSSPEDARAAPLAAPIPQPSADEESAKIAQKAKASSLFSGRLADQRVTQRIQDSNSQVLTQQAQSIGKGRHCPKMDDECGRESPFRPLDKCLSYP